ARLLDDDRGGADRGSLRRSAGSVGAVSRGGGLSWRPENLRVGHVHYVFARHVLLLCTAAAELPRGVYVPRPGGEGPAGAPGRAPVEDQDREHPENHAPRRGGRAHHRLAARGVPPAGPPHRKRSPPPP